MLLPPADQRQGKEELAKLLENLTVNETSFFRNKAQLDLFHKNVLEELLAQESRRDYSIRIWSAGCSTGQEAYTLAMLITDALAYYYLRNPLPVDMPLPKPLIPPPWRVEILASDISYSVLRAGQEATYSEHQMSIGRLRLSPALFRQSGGPLRGEKVFERDGALRLSQPEDGIPSAA